MSGRNGRGMRGACGCFDMGLDGFLTCFAGLNAHRVINRREKDRAIAPLV